MVPTTASPAQQAPVTEVAVKRDVGLLLGHADPHAAMAVARRMAIVSGGRVRLMRCVDSTGIRSAEELARRSAAARAQLAVTTAEELAEDPDVTERLHVGTLESLLGTLEPSIGALVVAEPRGMFSELSSACPVPLYLVDGEGIETGPPSAAAGR